MLSLSDKAPPTAFHPPPSTTTTTSTHSENHCTVTEVKSKNPAEKKTKGNQSCDRFGLTA